MVKDFGFAMAFSTHCSGLDEVASQECVILQKRLMFRFLRLKTGVGVRISHAISKRSTISPNGRMLASRCCLRKLRKLQWRN